MQVFFVRAQALDDPWTEATAFVVADREDEVLLLLKKDFNFTGYRLPPVEIVPMEASRAEVSEALGEPAHTEKGIYAFCGKQAPAAPR